MFGRACSGAVLKQTRICREWPAATETSGSSMAAEHAACAQRARSMVGNRQAGGIKRELIRAHHRGGEVAAGQQLGRHVGEGL
jgi:FAD synthase